MYVDALIQRLLVLDHLLNYLSKMLSTLDYCLAVKLLVSRTVVGFVWHHWWEIRLTIHRSPV